MCWLSGLKAKGWNKGFGVVLFEIISLLYVVIMHEEPQVDLAMSVSCWLSKIVKLELRRLDPNRTWSCSTITSHSGSKMASSNLPLVLLIKVRALREKINKKQRISIIQNTFDQIDFIFIFRILNWVSMSKLVTYYLYNTYWCASNLRQCMFFIISQLYYKFCKVCNL